MHFKQNQIWLNNTTLPKFIKKVFKKNTFENAEATPGRKRVWSEENNGKLWHHLWCGRKHGVVCLPPLLGSYIWRSFRWGVHYVRLTNYFLFFVLKNAYFLRRAHFWFLYLLLCRRILGMRIAWQWPQGTSLRRSESSENLKQTTIKELLNI